MPYILEPFFEPELKARQLAPKQREDGSVDNYDLGYVQNVIMQQVIGQFREVTEQEAAESSPALVFARRSEAVGENTALDPGVPDRLLALENGYPELAEGRVHVRKVLHVDSDVDYSTGNIMFVGDMVVRGNVRSGFSIKARNILVKGHIGGAMVDAALSVVAESGIKGNNTAEITAGKNIRAPFAENAFISAGETIRLDGHAMHCRLLAGKQCIIMGRLLGGDTYCTNRLHVEEQLAGGTGTVTHLYLGYPPQLLFRVQELGDTLEAMAPLMPSLKARSIRENDDKGPETARYMRALRKRQALETLRERILSQLEEQEHGEKCLITVPGEVRPGLHIEIGKVERRLNDYYSNVRFALDGDEINMLSPALT